MSPLIIGLPRSRTAWLSVFMSQSDVYFHHEALNGCHSIAEYKEKVKGCGDSSTALISSGLTIDRRMVIINKTDEQVKCCIDWCNAEYGIDSKDFILAENEKLKKLDGLHINQSDINSRLKDIWCHLVGTPWDDKYTKLSDFNIQVQSTSIDEEAAKALYESIQ